MRKIGENDNNLKIDTFLSFFDTSYMFFVKRYAFRKAATRPCAARHATKNVPALRRQARR